MADTPAPSSTNYLSFFDISGRNGYDDPFTLSQGQCCEAKNIDWNGAALAQRRGGSTGLSLAGGTPFAGGVRFLCRHVPGVDQSAAEAWGIDGTGRVKRLAAGVLWADVTLDDPITGNYGEVNAVSFNGKLFFAYQSGFNRLHVWDPVQAKIRRVGLAAASAPTVANFGGGAYAATIRYYKQQWARLVGGVLVDVGELSSAVSFTPSGAGTAARVTRAAAIGESETHWRLFGSPDNSNFFLLATTITATTTYDDSAAPASYAGEVAPVAGAHLPPPAAKYLVTDDGRIIMGGCYETAGGEVTASNTRIWWTSQLGSSNQGDDERISITSTISSFDDIEEAVTALSKPIQGAYFAFSYESQWKFVATGDVISPYQRFRVAGGQGCISHKSVLIASDDAGYPTTNWLSSRGGERSGRSGNQFLGLDMTDLWAGDDDKSFDPVNLDASTLPWGIYHRDIHQIWWYVAVGTSQTPNRRFVFDTYLGKVVDVFRQGAVRNGWSWADGEAAKAYCGAMLSDSVGASMGRLLKPYIGYTGAVEVWKCDTDDENDNGTAFQAYVESKPMAPWGLGRQGGLTQEPVLIASTNPSVSIQLKVIVDEYARVLTSLIPLKAVSETGSEVAIFAQAEDAKFSEANSVRFRLGDPDVVTASRWRLTALIVPDEAQGDR